MDLSECLLKIAVSWESKNWVLPNGPYVGIVI